ncbi:MAG: metallophosphoesterase [Methylococcales bacterium]|nr:metallophosphoesterase [Methylococcales bacterium]
MFNISVSKSPIRHAVLAASFALLAAAPVAPSFASDPVVLTFSTVGDSRQDTSGPDETSIISNQVGVGTCYYPNTAGYLSNPGLTGQDCKWLQNSTAWSRIVRTIQSQKSNLLFFNGDMIMGYGKAGVPVTRNSTGVSEVVISNPAVSDILNSDLLNFYQQYSFWRGMVAPLMETGTYVVPVPGNHETQCKRCGKASVVENENAWRGVMGDLILDQTRLNNSLASTGLSLNASTWNLSNTPSSTAVINGVTNPDNISTSQQQLSYSFDIGSNHFSIINTDPVGNDSHAPYNWLDADLTAAVANGATHLFVFGHKPAFYYYYAGSNVSGTGLTTSASSSLYLTDATAATNFWAVISKHNATYFCGHEHVYNVSQPINNDTPTGGAAYQVIVGAGGSPFDDLLSSTSTPETVGTVTGEVTGSVTALESDRMYSWATVSIHQSGAVTMTTYGFDPTITNGSMNAALKTLGTFTLPTAK